MVWVLNWCTVYEMLDYILGILVWVLLVYLDVYMYVFCVVYMG